MSREVLTVLIAVLAASGCTMEMQRRSETRYLESDLICSIDTSVADETDRLLPNGFLTKPYSPDLWQTYWKDRVTYLAQEDFSRERRWGYTGPSGRTLALYLLRRRKEDGMPDLTGANQNEQLIGELYSELHRRGQSSCEILERNSPVCQHSPAQRNGSLRLERQCRVDPNNSFEQSKSTQLNSNTEL